MFRLPFSFIITGIVGFVLFHALTLVDFAGWIGAEPRSPDGLFRVHLLVLGWATMIAMGAVYQLLNVILQTQFYSEKIGFVHYGFFTVGTMGLLPAFAARIRCGLRFVRHWRSSASCCLRLTLHDVVQAGQWHAITVSTASAIGYLILTGLIGAAMGLDWPMAGSAACMSVCLRPIFGLAQSAGSAC